MRLTASIRLGPPGDGERVIYWTYHPERSMPAVGLEVPRTLGL